MLHATPERNSKSRYKIKRVQPQKFDAERATIIVKEKEKKNARRGNGR
jgi:hypothetical protein